MFSDQLTKLEKKRNNWIILRKLVEVSNSSNLRKLENWSMIAWMVVTWQVWARVWEMFCKRHSRECWGENFNVNWSNFPSFHWCSSYIIFIKSKLLLFPEKPEGHSFQIFWQKKDQIIWSILVLYICYLHLLWTLCRARL